MSYRTSENYKKDSVAFYTLGCKPGEVTRAALQTVVYDSGILWDTAGLWVPVSDKKGNLLFYTNGAKVYDRLHRIIPGGNILGTKIPYFPFPLIGDIAIIPQPGNESRYYVFFTIGTADNGWTCMGGPAGLLQYFVVDLSLNGGYGSVIETQLDYNLKNAVYPASLNCVRLPGGKEYRLSYLTDTLLIQRVIDSSGLKAEADSLDIYDTFKKAGTLRAAYNVYRMCYASFDLNDSLIGIVFSNYPDSNAHILITKYDKSSGILDTSKYIFVGLADKYGIAKANFFDFIFSLDGKNIFYSGSKLLYNHGPCNADTLLIYQMDISSWDSSTIVASKKLLRRNKFSHYYFGIYNIPSFNYDFRYAPFAYHPIKDEILIEHHAINGMKYDYPMNFVVGKIENPDSLLPKTSINENYIDLGTFNSKWYPYRFTQFTTRYRNRNSFMWEDKCGVVSFKPDSTKSFTNLSWNFGDSAGTDTSNFSSANTPKHTYLKNGTFTVMLAFTENGIPDTFFQNVCVSSILEFPKVPDTTFCAGSSLVINTPLPGNFKTIWLTDDTTNSKVINTTGSFSYRIVNQLNGCVFFDTFSVGILPLPGLKGFNDTFLCKGSSLNLAVIASAFDSAVWNGAIKGNPFPINQPGSYNLAVYRKGCKETDSFSVKENSVDPIGDEDTNMCFEDNRFYLVVGSPKGKFYQWLPGNETSPSLKIKQEGKFVLVLTDSFGCVFTDSIQVGYYCPERVFYPSAFTPNANGLNDTFFFSFDSQASISAFSIAIYNRWGEQIFYSTDKGFKWDGNFDGSPCMQGVYYFEAIIQFTGSKRNRVQGIIHLIRL